MSILVALLDGRKSITLSKAPKMLGFSVRSLRRYAAAGSRPGVFRLRPRGGRVEMIERWWGIQGLNSHGR